jgi:hypothetical protein
LLKFVHLAWMVSLYSSFGNIQQFWRQKVTAACLVGPCRRSDSRPKENIDEEWRTSRAPIKKHRLNSNYFRLNITVYV